MRTLAFLVLLIPALAVGQGLNLYAPGQAAKPRTNYAKQSNSLSTGTGGTSPWGLYLASVTTETSPTPLGGGTWAKVVGAGFAGGGGILYATVTIPSSRSFVTSAYVSNGGGDGKAAVAGRCVGASLSSCTCGRSDGGACTAQSLTNATDCEAYIADATAGFVRVWAVTTCTGNITAPVIMMYAGQPSTSVTTAMFSGLQVEVGVTKPSKLCVTTSAAKTCK